MSCAMGIHICREFTEARLQVYLFRTSKFFNNKNDDDYYCHDNNGGFICDEGKKGKRERVPAARRPTTCLYNVMNNTGSKRRIHRMIYSQLITF